MGHQDCFIDFKAGCGLENFRKRKKNCNEIYT